MNLEFGPDSQSCRISYRSGQFSELQDFPTHGSFPKQYSTEGEASAPHALQKVIHTPYSCTNTIDQESNHGGQRALTLLSYLESVRVPRQSATLGSRAGKKNDQDPGDRYPLPHLSRLINVHGMIWGATAMQSGKKLYQYYSSRVAASRRCATPTSRLIPSSPPNPPLLLPKETQRHKIITSKQDG